MKEADDLRQEAKDILKELLPNTLDDYKRNRISRLIDCISGAVLLDTCESMIKVLKMENK